MTTNAKKPVICYGAFVNLERIENLGLYACRIGVTSFSTNWFGTQMAHGHSLEPGNYGQTTHRKAETMRFYPSEDRMNLCIERAFNLAGDYDSAIEAAEKKLAEVKRQRRISCEQALGRHEIQPSELV